MNNHKKLKTVGKVLLDILEIYIPIILFLTLFVCFLIGIVWRYVFDNPQSWTFELSSICYLAVGVLTWGFVQRTEENVVFDMFYNKQSAKFKCIMRILTNLLIAAVSVILIHPSIVYLKSLAGLSAQTMPIPRFVIFLPFTVSFVVAAIRSVYYLILEVKGFIRKDYSKKYGKEESAA